MTVTLALQQPKPGRIFFRDRFNCYRDVGPLLPVILCNRCVVHAVEMVACQDQDIFHMGGLDLEQLLTDRIRRALIEKFVGDGLTAFFAPAFAGSNHALTAIKAGKEILRAIGHGPGKTPWIPVGVGVNTGVAYIGSMKMEGGRTDITILGDVVNTTARLCSQAPPGEVLVGEDAMEMSGLSRDEHELRQLSLKGKQEVVDAWVVSSE